MDRLTGTVIGLLAVCFALPVLVPLAQAAVPYLLSLLILLAIVRLARPPRRWR